MICATVKEWLTDKNIELTDDMKRDLSIHFDSCTTCDVLLDTLRDRHDVQVKLRSIKQS